MTAAKVLGAEYRESRKTQVALRVSGVATSCRLSYLMRFTSHHADSVNYDRSHTTSQTAVLECVVEEHTETLSHVLAIIRVHSLVNIYCPYPGRLRQGHLDQQVTFSRVELGCKPWPGIRRIGSDGVPLQDAYDAHNGDTVPGMFWQRRRLKTTQNGT